MQIRDIMTHSFMCIERHAAIRNAAELMRKLDVGMLPVKEDGEIIGAVTDRDITVRATAKGADPNTTTVGDIMSNEVYTCYEDNDVEQAARIMGDHQIHRLMVTNNIGEFVGMLAIADLARNPKTERLTAGILEEVTQPLHNLSHRELAH
ncbi:MAG: CBS domain-containing protein [Gammaproteobacteria bacterium]